MNALEKLREGYARDLIDLETFERFVGWILEGKHVALPVDVATLGRDHMTDAPGGVMTYWPVTAKGHDWYDGAGPVHSISLEQHHENRIAGLRTLRDRAAGKHGLR